MTDLDLKAARAAHEASLPIRVGQQYEFYSELQQSQDPPEERNRNYTGQMVTVIAGPLQEEEGDNGPDDEEGASDLFRVRAADGREFEAYEEELTGWDKVLGQYFWPDGTCGPDHDPQFLCNERSES